MVVVIGPVFPFRGGIADTNTTFVNTLIEQKEEVMVFSFSLLYPRLLFPGKSQFSTENNDANFRVERSINTLNPISWWNTAKRIQKLNPKVVVFRYWTPWLALCYRTIAGLINSKKIAWIDNALPHERKISDSALLGTFLEGIDEIVCMSKAVSATIKERTSKNTTTLFHPINTTLPDAIEKNKAISELGLDKTKTYLLFFGLIRPYKGLDLLIKSLPQLRKNCPNTQVLVVGEPYESLRKYRELAVSLKVDDMLLFHDRFVPSNEIALWFSACDWVVQPYTSATQSGVTPMAIHFSTPTVVTNVGGLADGITPQIGIVTNPSPTALSNALTKAINNAKVYQSEKAFLELKEEKSWHHFCVLFTNTFKT